MADKEKYLISIIGEQTLDGETDKVEVLTSGNYMMKKNITFELPKQILTQHR